MIATLVSGQIFAKPERVTSKGGLSFVRFKVRIPTSAGASVISRAVCFSTAVGEQVLALGEGDSICLSGTLNVKPWLNGSGEARVDLDLVVNAILTPYHVSQKKTAMQACGRGKKGVETITAVIGEPAGDDFREDTI